ncbi:hypothetical protein VK792_17635, partial [Mesobacterium sp. TK19101]
STVFASRSASPKSRAKQSEQIYVTIPPRDVKNRLGQPSRFLLFPIALTRIPRILQPVVGAFGGSS